MDPAALVEVTRRVLEARADELIAAYVFGSVARGTATARSDLDLGLLFRHAPESSLSGLGFDIAFELELALKRQVDVVVLNRASPDLVHRVLRDGILVLESDRRARVEFEVHARAQFFDLAPLRRLYRHGRTAAAVPTPEVPASADETRDAK
ncbi:MAG TPA: nucleotidyltransferase domain-containing protein [Polyangiaceae bacterium]|nr:nucleotidyltransferase domain-containing protein [Polyangiaceae bacterium]